MPKDLTVSLKDSEIKIAISTVILVVEPFWHLFLDTTETDLVEGHFYM